MQALRTCFAGVTVRGPSGTGRQGARAYGGDVAITDGRKRAYAWMMGACLTLFVLAGLVVRHWSVPLAIAMCVVAAVIPPAAAVVANTGALADHRPPPEPPDPDR